MMRMPEGLESYGRFIEALNCGAVIVDRSGTIRRVNRRACEMTGFTHAELLDRDVRTLHGTDHCRECVRKMVEHFDEPYESEFGLPRRDGGLTMVMLSARPLNGNGAPPQYRLATFIDISGLKEAQRTLGEQRDEMARMNDTVIEQALALKHHSRELQQRVNERTHELREANLDAIYMLAVASEAKDADTGAHVRRIERNARLLAETLGLSEMEAARIGYSAVLHDVGKLYIADHILQKPAPLDDAERNAMRQHTLAGEQILSARPFFSTARHIARSHHENWDGSGYPDGVMGEAIPLPARIVHVVDVYDALTHRRVYKDAWQAGSAVAWIGKQAGTAFDPDVTAAFMRLFVSGKLRDGKECGETETFEAAVHHAASRPHHDALAGATKQ